MYYILCNGNWICTGCSIWIGLDFRTLPKTPSWKIQPWVVKFQFIGVISNRTSFLLKSPFLLGISSIEPYPNPQVEKYNPGSIVHECKWIQYLTLKWGCIEADTVFEIESNQSMWNTVLYLAFAFHELFTGKQ